MTYSRFIGIDISKATLDVSVKQPGGQLSFSTQVPNSPKGLKTLDQQLVRKGIDWSQTLICAEHTGVYSNPLRTWSQQNGYVLWLEQPLQIKRSQGFTRGKSDVLDAERIAEYARRYQDKYTPEQPRSPQLELLKELLNQRGRLQKALKELMSPLSNASFYSKAVVAMHKKVSQRSCEAIKKDIKQTEQLIRQTIASDQELTHLFELATSVDGIGLVSATWMIVTSNAFKTIREAKKFACYAGVVPFEYQSGTSLTGKPRVSHMANKRVKAVLYMAALSAVKMSGELRDYYLRKTQEGKAKMSVLNAVRNKLILRVYACVQANRRYEKKYVPDLI